jgi:hypothetical protein
LWFHVVGQVDYVNSLLNIYINGALSVSGSTALFTQGTTSDTNSKNASIGSTDNAAADFFNGSIEDVRLYSRLLSNSEISTIYAGKGKDGIVDNLQQRFLMNELPPGSIVDTVPSIAAFDGRVGSGVGSPVYTNDSILVSRMRSSANSIASV